MAVKKLIQGQPKLNDLSQYNFENQDDNYKESLGLPKNNDKFQNKDLYTKAVGSELNNAIIERNLKVEGESFIKIDRLFIGSAITDGATANNRVRCYMFSSIINVLYSSIALVSVSLNGNIKFALYSGVLFANSSISILSLFKFCIII